MIELSKYTLDTLRNDKEVNFYRGWSEEDISQILVLSPGTEYPAPEILKRLEHEYSSGKSWTPLGLPGRLKLLAIGIVQSSC